MNREITLIVSDDNSGFKVGDKITFKNPLDNAIITDIHILTPKEIAQNEKRAEMRKKEEEYFSRFCPECGQSIEGI